MIMEDPQVLQEIRHCEKRIESMTGCVVHLAIDAFEIKENRKEQLRDIVCKYYGLPWEKIIATTNKKREEADAMKVFMFLARKHLKCTYVEIGDYCGSRHHTTVLVNCQKVSDFMDIKDAISFDVLAIKKILQDEKI